MREDEIHVISRSIFSTGHFPKGRPIHVCGTVDIVLEEGVGKDDEEVAIKAGGTDIACLNWGLGYRGLAEPQGPTQRGTVFPSARSVLRSPLVLSVLRLFPCSRTVAETTVLNSSRPSSMTSYLASTNFPGSHPPD